MSKLLIDEFPLIILPKLAVSIGLNEAIVLQQIHYLTNKNKVIKDDLSWVFKTYEDWVIEFPFWSPSTIKRIVQNLEKHELIITTNDYNKMKSDRTKWYRINYEKLDPRTNSSDPEVKLTPATGQSDLLRAGQSDPSNTIRKEEENNIFALSDKRRRGKKPHTLNQYLEQCEKYGVFPIPEDSLPYRKASELGIDLDWVPLLWFRYKQTYATSTAKKKYKSWLEAFTNAVRDAYYGLWWMNHDNQFELTSKGRMVAEQMRRAEASDGAE